MKATLAAFTFISAIASTAISNAAEPGAAITQAYAIKDLTVSGILGIAVVVLYRELGKERQKQETRDLETKQFVVEQTKIVAEAAKLQADALKTMQDTMRQQVDIYRGHINALVEAVTKNANR